MGVCTSSLCKNDLKRSGTPDTFASDETNVPEELSDYRFSLIRDITREWLDMAATRCRRPGTPMFGSATPGFGVNESLTW